MIRPSWCWRKEAYRREQPDARDAAIVAFERYAIDLGQFAGDSTMFSYKPRERSTLDLMTMDTSGLPRALSGRVRAELHDRFSAPLYPIAFMAIAFAALGVPRTTRQGRGTAIAAAVAAVAVMRIVGSAFGEHRHPVRPCGSADVSAADSGHRRVAGARARTWLVQRRAARLAAPAARPGGAAGASMITAPTLSRYFLTRFPRAIAGVFLTVFVLIYVIDFVELVRRTGDVAGVSTAMLARLALFRTPAVAEQILPFAVLFGSMAALLNLSRKLELVVARSAGMSVWQFLAAAAASGGCDRRAVGHRV
jgi:lipopolysaccharide export LptBFGC system permease protein LptF